jgi:hypothetical protein
MRFEADASMKIQWATCSGDRRGGKSSHPLSKDRMIVSIEVEPATAKPNNVGLVEFRYSPSRTLPLLKYTVVFTA